MGGGFVSLGWDELGDLNSFGDREDIKSRLRIVYPGEKEGAYVNWAAILTKFAHDLQPGDYVISPVKATRTVDIGVVREGYWFESDAPHHKHRLPVEWLATGIDRDEFSESARYEIGGALTLFRVKRTAAEFADQVSVDLRVADDQAPANAREEILGAIRQLVDGRPDRTFTPQQVVAFLQSRGTRLKESTIRTHVVSMMCLDAPVNHTVTYPDLRRVGRGLYTLAEDTR